MPFIAEEGCPRLFVHFELPVVDERQSREDVGAGRDVAVEIVVELPESGQRAKGDVELSVAPLAGLTGHAEDLAHFGTDRHRVFAGGAIQPLDVAALFPHAHQRIEAVELVEDRLERRRVAVRSSAVHAVRWTSEPMLTRERSTMSAGMADGGLLPKQPLRAAPHASDRRDLVIRTRLV